MYQLSKRIFAYPLIILLVGLQLPSVAGAGSLKAGLDQLATQITAGLEQGQKQYVAVPDFTDLNGATSELGMLVSEELLTRLHNSQKVKLVERRLLDKIIEEHRLGLTALLDEQTVKQLGRILGVDALCTGTVTDLRETIRINARMIAVETGQVFAVAAAEVDKSDALRILMRKYTQARNIAEKQQPGPDRKQGTNLLVNGGVTDRLNGWTRQLGDMRQGASKTDIIDYSGGTSGKTLYLKHEGNGHIQLAQIVNVPTVDLIFFASFHAATHEGMLKGFSGSGVAQIGLQYLDRQGTKLGQTVLLGYVKNPFADTPLLGVPRRQSDSYETHFIEVENNRYYHGYQLDIRQEIESNLLAVDPDAVEEVAVILWAGANHAQAGAELGVTDVSLKIK